MIILGCIILLVAVLLIKRKRRNNKKDASTYEHPNVLDSGLFDWLFDEKEEK